MPEAVADQAEIEGRERPLSLGNLSVGQDLAYHIAEVSNNVGYANVRNVFERGRATEYCSSNLYHAGRIGYKLKAMVLYDMICGEKAPDIPYASPTPVGTVFLIR